MQMNSERGEKRSLYIVNDSFQTGFKVDLKTLVLYLCDFFSLLGISRHLAYGSDNPFGSIGIKFFASCT